MLNAFEKERIDFTFIDDVVACNMLAAQSSKSKGQFYNVGGGSQISIDELAELIIELTNSKSTKEYKAPGSGDVQDSLASLEKIGTDVGYEPKWEIRDGLMKTIEWMSSSTGSVE